MLFLHHAPPIIGFIQGLLESNNKPIVKNGLVPIVYSCSYWTIGYMPRALRARLAGVRAKKPIRQYTIIVACRVASDALLLVTYVVKQRKKENGTKKPLAN